MNDRRRAEHAPLTQFPIADDCLVVGGQKLAEVAEQTGTTPFYTYSRDAISQRIAELRSVLPDAVHLHYAVKANPRPDVVDHIRNLVDGLDVASAGELKIALDSGMNPEKISFAGPGKTTDELRFAVQSGIIVNVESINEIRRLAQIARDNDERPRIAIRVNPDFELKTSGMKMSGGPKQFGIDAELVPDVLSEVANLPLEFVGFHIFSGSQNLNPDAIIEAQEQTVERALKLARHAPGPVQLLNIGGGFGIPYFPGEQRLDLEPIAARLGVLCPLIQKALPDAEIVIELGRYIVGEAGVYVCRVIDRKTSRGQVFLVTDGGLHHHLAASGNFGQVIRKNYPVVTVDRVHGGERETASVVGPLCTPLDLLADRMELGRADIGDLIGVLQSGAYGLTASPTAFLSHPAPREILV